ncbi:MAG: pyridoxal phosphate-dependent aminotransferase, partial [Actinomycetota bacterium]
LDAVVAHLARMRDLTLHLVGAHLPGVTVHRPDATYLAWLDCRATPISENPHAAFRASGVETSDGDTFGPGGQGHVRLNFATSSTMLGQIVATMGAAVRP